MEAEIRVAAEVNNERMKNTQHMQKVFTYGNVRMAVMLICMLFILPVLAQKQPKSLTDAQKNKKKLNEEIKKLDAVLGQTKTKRNITMLHVQALNIKISKREELINTINYEIKVINGQISRKQRELDIKSAELDTLKSRYKKLIRYAYRNQDNYNKLMFVFASKDFNQAYERVRYMQEINIKRRAHADSILAKQSRLGKEKQQLLAKIEEKKNLLTSEEQEKLNLAKEKSQQEDELGKLSADERKIKEELEDKRKDVAAIDKKIKDMIAKIAADKEKRDAEERERRKKEKALAEANKKKNQNKNNTKSKTKVEPERPKITKDPDEELSEDFASNKGRLPWPVVNAVITEGFGQHEHPKIKDFIINNSGVNITAANKNASARSIFDGEVTLIAPMPDGEGKIVIVRHGSYLSVYTNLSKVLVKTGDKVKVKQSIGEIAYDESNGGTTMNLQIWKGQIKLNPEDWLYHEG